jgi:site-specific recombinase XerD
MFKKLFGKASDVVYHTLGPYAAERERFLEHCRDSGFAKTCLKQAAGIVLTAAIDLQSHGGLDVDEAFVEAAALRIEKIRAEAGVTRGAREYRQAFMRFTTRWLLFTGHLRGAKPRPQPYAALLDDFVQWMRQERGLSPSTLDSRRRNVGTFLEWLYERRRRVSDLDLRELDGYLQHVHGKGHSRMTIRAYVNAVRAFVRHGERRGWCSRGLADQLHGPRIYREHGLPLGPSWDEVSRLIEGATSDDPVDVRDRAILLLFAVYGLRAGEVAGLRIEDVDWDHDRLTVRRSKQGRGQVYPLAPIVGQAIARYLQRARPRSRFRELFLKLRAPVGPMTSRTLYPLVAHRMERAGIQAPHRGPHVLRHACAGHLLARGLSLKEIGDHLGHRRPDSTRIYAKVDLQGLREVAAFGLGGLV